MIDRTFTRVRLIGMVASALAVVACSETVESSGISTSLVAGQTQPPAGEDLAQASDTTEMAVQAADPAAPPAAAPASGSFLALSDVHRLRDGHPCSGPTCQTSPAFWTATQDRAQALIASDAPDFVIYLGDMPEHGIYDPSERRPVLASVLDGLANIVSGTTTPLLYLPGNNDTMERNPARGDFDYCPFTDDEQSVFNTVSDPTVWPVINGAADIIDPDHLADGYYAARLTVGAGGSPLRVLALNTNIYTTDYGRCSDQAAAAGSTQLDWLASQLEAAGTANEPVLLAMHVPPGTNGHGGGQMWGDSLLYQGSDTTLAGRLMQDVLLTFIDRNQATITTILSGHTHLNGIRRLHACDATGEVTELLVSIPGISTDHGNTPGMKVFTFGAGLEPIDITTYGATYVAPPVDDYSWSGEVSYNFRTHYPNTTPDGTSLLGQVDSMSDDARWAQMWRYLNVSSRDTPAPPVSHYRSAMEVTCTP